MTNIAIYDAAGRGMDIQPGLSPLGSDVEETFVSEQYIGGGYYIAETSVSGADGIADAASYLYYYNASIDQIIYERVEGRWHGDLTLSISDASVSLLDLNRLGVQAFFVGDDAISGNRYDDYIIGFGGNDLLNGQGGTDTVGMTGVQENYTLTLSPESITIEDRRTGGDGVDRLMNIEAVEFFGDSQTFQFDLTVFAGVAGLSSEQMNSFIELYIAYFNRAPDAVGLNFWGTAYANGTSLEQMASLFIDQDETRAAYPDGLSNSEFATAVYSNVLGRQADQDGFDFWVSQLDSGSVGRDQFILAILQGAKADPPVGASQDFIQQQLADQSYLSDKTDIGAYFAVHKGMSDVGDAVSSMALFDGTASGLSDAIAAIDAQYLEALSATEGEFLMPVVGVLDNPFEAA